jgi:hypothetical protein
VAGLQWVELAVKRDSGARRGRQRKDFSSACVCGVVRVCFTRPIRPAVTCCQVRAATSGTARCTGKQRRQKSTGRSAEKSAESRQKRGQKKPGHKPRSNNDKRRMVPRLGHQARTVCKDSNAPGEFAEILEIF